MARIKEEDLRLNIIINSDGKTKLSQLEKQTKMNTMSLSELQKHLKLTNTALSKAVPGTQNWKNLQAEVNRTRQRLVELKGGADKTAASLKSMAGKYLGIGVAVSALGKGLKNAVNNIADFEQANVNLSTILGVNVKQMGLLMDDALELGRRTQYTASQVTGLQTELAKLGFTQNQIHQMTAPTLNFATAVGTDLSSAASMAGATLRIFGLDAKDTEDALGVLAVSTNRSALDFSYLQTAMSTVGPVAKSFGFSLRDTTTLLGTLANAGFDASSAATATRNILLNLADSSGKLATALGKPVKTFPELMEGLQTLQERGINLNEALAITDKRSVSAFSRFLEGTKDAEALRAALEDVSGELDRIAEERMNTVQGAVKSLQSAWEGFTLAFSNSKGPIKDFLQWMADTINKITDKLTEKTKNREAGGISPDSYALNMDRIYNGDSEKVYQAIGEDIDKTESELNQLQKIWDNHLYSGLAQKRRIKKQIEDQSNFLQLLKQSKESYTDYLNFESGNYYETAPEPESQGNSTGAGIDTNKDKWSLNNDASFLTAKAALTKRFNDGEIASKEEFDEQLYQLEIASLNARLALHREKGADRAAIEADLQTRIMKHDEQARKEAEKLEGSLQTDKIAAARDAEQRRYEEDLRAFEKSRSALEDQAKVKEDIEAKHRRNMLKIDNDATLEQLRLQKTAHETEIEDIRNTHMAGIITMRQGSFAQAQATRAMQEEIAASELAFLADYLERLKELEKSQGAAGADQSDIESTRKAIQDAIAEILRVKQELNEGKQDGIFSGTGNGSLFGISQGQWQQFFKNLKNGKLGADDLAAAIQAAGEMANQAMSIATQAIDMTNAKENQAFKEYQDNNNKKRKELEDRLRVGLITQAQYDRAMASLQEQEDSRQEELQAAQAERQKKAAIAQATIQAALAVAKTFAEWGWPLGIAPAAVMTALGAAQVAMIAATPTGYAEGGEVTRAQDGRKFNAHLSPSKRGFISSPTILVGEEGGEYVIPADGLRNPSLAPFIGSIEAARRAGTLRNINFGAVSPVMSSVVPAMASGGSTTPISIPAADYTAILEGMKELGKKMENIRAVVPMLGKGGIGEALDDYDKIKNGVCLRNRRPGDYIVIDDNGNTQSYKKFCIGAKIPLDIRYSVPLIALDKEILWVVGYRMGSSNRITDDTKMIMEVKFTGGIYNE